MATRKRSREPERSVIVATAAYPSGHDGAQDRRGKEFVCLFSAMTRGRNCLRPFRDHHPLESGVLS